MKYAVLPLALAAIALGVQPARADLIDVTVTVENLAPVRGVSFAPLRVGFHNGSYDAFNNGQTPSAAIISIAEGGSGSDWFPAFAAVDPTATLGSVGGALLPGLSASNTFRIDSTLNPFFTFASMLLPSNDLFIGNDSPVEFRLFNPTGGLAISSITQRGRSIWDAGSEVADPANAAFVVGGTNALRTPQNGVVSFSRSELGAFDGVQTAGGYTYDNSLLTADGEVYRISFQAAAVPAVPAPPAIVLALIAVGGAGLRYRLGGRRSTPVV